MPRPTGSALMEKIVALCKRRGFIFQASEIYGGLNGFWDYGPLGSLLKNNLRDAWWRDMVLCPPVGPDGEPLQIVGLDSSIIQHPKTWVASGHVGGFNDPMVDDKETKQRYRADHIFGLFVVPASKDKMADSLTGLRQSIGNDMSFAPVATVVATTEGEAVSELLEFFKKKEWKELQLEREVKTDDGRIDFVFRNKKTGETLIGEVEPVTFKRLMQIPTQVPAPGTRHTGVLTEPRQFNLMFQTYVGAVQDDESKAYLRPETAQGIFLEYKNILDSTRVKVPFGVAQIGKSFRNEVTPRNYIFRSREFEQMEMEWFCPPDESNKWYQYWRDERLRWWTSVGVKRENLKLREHDPEELSHYSKATADIEYQYPFTAPGFGELEGVAHRGCFDLTQHQQHSGAKLEYFDQERQEKKIEPTRYLPHVIEPASGLTRGVLVLLCEAYDVDETRPSPELMRFHPAMAPVKCGIFPLVNKDGMPEIALKLYHELRRKYVCQYDGKQSIGKRYARMDEAGTPFCLTVDGQTKDDQTITVRDRDTGTQIRVNLDKVGTFLSEKLAL